MSPDIIQAIVQFMSRTQLSGGEVEAYQRCMDALKGSGDNR